MDGSGVAGLEVAGGVPNPVGVLGSHNHAEHAAEVAGGGDANTGGGTTRPQGALADAGMVAPKGEGAWIRGTGDVVQHEMGPAGVRVHAGFQVEGRPQSG